MFERIFKRAKLERVLDHQTAPIKFVAANGEQIRDMGEKTVPFKAHDGNHRRITFRSACVPKLLISMSKVI